MPFGHKLGKNTCYIVELVVLRHVCLIQSNFSALTGITNSGNFVINTRFDPPAPSIVYRNLPVHTDGHHLLSAVKETLVCEITEITDLHNNRFY